MPTKQVIDLEAKRERRLRPAWLVILVVLLLAAFATLLLVGFENVLALLRYRVALFLLLAPLLALFLFCAWKAFGPRDRE
jgi:hypothetical protein